MVAFVVPAVLRGQRPLHWPGLIPVGLGSALLLWCVVAFITQGRGTLAPWDPPRQLVIAGPYGRTRNPMYVAVLLIVVGWALAFTSVAVLAYAVALAGLFHWRVTRYEEPWAARTFGEAWTHYAACVPRWWR